MPSLASMVPITHMIYRYTWRQKYSYAWFKKKKNTSKSCEGCSVAKHLPSKPHKALGWILSNGFAVIHMAGSRCLTQHRTAEEVNSPYSGPNSWSLWTTCLELSRVLLGRSSWQARRQPHRLPDSSHSRSCEDSDLVSILVEGCLGGSLKGFRALWIRPTPWWMCFQEAEPSVSSWGLRAIVGFCSTCLHSHHIPYNPGLVWKLWGRGLLAPHWAASLPLTILMLDLFQALICWSRLMIHPPHWERERI